MKKIIFIIIVLLCSIIALLGLLLWYYKRIPVPPPQGGDIADVSRADNTPENIAVKEFDDSIFNVAETQNPTDEEQAKAEVGLIARTFTEDYGSYSTNSGYSHIEELFPTMTEAMQNRARVWLQSDPVKKEGSAFYSIETSVSQTEFVEFSLTDALITVDAVRTETKVPEYYNKKFNQKADITLIKKGEQWKVADIVWRNP